MIDDKRKLYKTAFSPIHGVFVGIDDSYKNKKGDWAFVCSSSYHRNPEKRFSKISFTETQLTNFVL